MVPGTGGGLDPDALGDQLVDSAGGGHRSRDDHAERDHLNRGQRAGGTRLRPLAPTATRRRSRRDYARRAGALGGGTARAAAARTRTAGPGGRTPRGLPAVRDEESPAAGLRVLGELPHGVDQRARHPEPLGAAEKSSRSIARMAGATMVTISSACSRLPAGWRAGSLSSGGCRAAGGGWPSACPSGR